MSIYEDVQTLETLINQCFNEQTGEILPEDEQAYKELKKELTENGLERCAKVVANKKSFVDGVSAEIDRLTAAKRRESKQIEWLLNYMLLIFNQTEKDKKGHVKAGTFDISVRKSTVVKLTNDFDNPLYQEEVKTIKIDKTKIKADLKAGIPVLGAMLEEKQNLQIN